MLILFQIKTEGLNKTLEDIFLNMKKLIVFFFIFPICLVHAQSEFGVDKKGEDLKKFYLSLNVENLWLAGYHVNWETGVADKPDATSGNRTHCSAFAAAACKKLNIYLLRPPDHKQILLANAQYDWLPTQAAKDVGWQPIANGNQYETAQTLANSGHVVIAVCKNPNSTKPGHVALVLPSKVAKDKLIESGPELIMAGTHNHNMISLKAGFHSHLDDEWPEHLILFYYDTQVPYF